MKTIINTSKAPQPIGPYSQAVKSDDFLYLSGQLGIDPATGKMVEGGVKSQSRQIFKNISAILDEAGIGFQHVIKVTCLLIDLNDFQEINSIYAEYFTQNFPARTTFQVARLPMDAAIEIEVVARVD